MFKIWCAQPPEPDKSTDDILLDAFNGDIVFMDIIYGRKITDVYITYPFSGLAITMIQDLLNYEPTDPKLNYFYSRLMQVIRRHGIEFQLMPSKYIFKITYENAELGIKNDISHIIKQVTPMNVLLHIL